MTTLRWTTAAAAALACVLTASPGAAEVFYTGNTKGLPGAALLLNVHVSAGSVLESIDISPDFEAVTSILSVEEMVATSALTDGGFGSCEDNRCAFSYVEEKNVTADTLLLTYRLRLAASAPLGLVDFDVGVTFGQDPVPLPDAMRFEVLAIPEPHSVWLLGLGAGIVGLRSVRRRRPG